MSRVLLLARELPHPPNAGDRIVTHGFVRALAARGHDVHVLAYRRDGDESDAAALREPCASVRRIPSADSPLPPTARKLANYARGRSDVMAMFDSRAFRVVAAQRVREVDPDVVLAQHPYIGQVVRDERVARAIDETGARVVTNAHVVEYAAHRRFRECTDDPSTRAELALEIPLLRRSELAVYEASDRTLVLGERDRERLDALDALDVRVQRVALDADAYRPADPAAAVPDRLLFFGSYNWFPNRDGIAWFVEEILPTVRRARPDVELLVAGRGAPESIRNLGDRPNVRFVGEVEDLAPLVRSASAVVAPLRVGGGVRIKVLESMAWGVPVVTTPSGFEGVEATPGEDLLVPDSAEGFADATVRLLEDGRLRERIARNARGTIRKRYSTDAVADRLEENLGLR
ncbi:glycosyltransferase family 4 protein [Halomarina pelagica]|uniref:glycosyltransferase family 4 protein n=1 Tax=Halomarina pelagica TaxID=2961599 RepID=UPI0020C4F817|nr:glycosyltransferase family 4 protein [Halomarina sp. BND7]